MDHKKNMTGKHKKKVRKKRDTKKPMKKLSEQNLYIGPGPYFEKLPKGQTNFFNNLLDSVREKKQFLKQKI